MTQGRVSFRTTRSIGSSDHTTDPSVDNMSNPVVSDEQIQSLEGDIAVATGYRKVLQANLVALTAEPSLNDIRANITALELEKEELVYWIQGLQSGKIKLVPMAQQEEAERTLTEWKRKSERRKHIFYEMWNMVQDSMPDEQTKNQLWVRITSTGYSTSASSANRRSTG